MLIVNDGATLARALHGTAGSHVKRLLALRRSQLGDSWPRAATFYVAEDGDTIADMETGVGFPLTIDGEPACDWAVSHRGVTEVAFDLAEDMTQVLLVPQRPEIGADLLAFARAATGGASAAGDEAQTC